MHVQIPQNDPRRVMPRRAGDATTRMCAGAAVIKAGEGAAIVGVAEHGAGGEELVEGVQARRERCRRR